MTTVEPGGGAPLNGVAIGRGEMGLKVPEEECEG